MSAMHILFLVVVFVLAAAAVAVLVRLFAPDLTQKRLRHLAGNEGAGSGGAGADRWVEVIADLTAPLSKLALPEEGFEKSSLRLKFVHAGLRGANAPRAFFGLKAALTLGLPLLGLGAVVLGGGELTGNNLLLVLLLLAALGYYIPNLVLGKLVERRQRELFEVFPDSLDLMTICVEAGLGTEAAMMRVAEDIQMKSPVLADELRLVNLEIRAGADRERALRNLAFRTGVEEIDSFVTLVVQAERFGTSIAASLRVHSDMLRTRRRQMAEEAASKISLKLLFPLMFCIFPSLMVVLMGPAMINVMHALSSAGGSGG